MTTRTMTTMTHMTLRMHPRLTIRMHEQIALISCVVPSAMPRIKNNDTAHSELAVPLAPLLALLAGLPVP